MTPSDDILDLLGRYATGSLTAEERQRLLDAALNDQELFEELAREQELKMLLEQPGARDRMIRALEPPKRRMAWIFGVAATAALSAALVVVLSRPVPKPPQIAVAKIPPPAPIVQPKSVRAEPKPSETPRRNVTPKEIAKAKAGEVPVVTPESPGAAAETDQPQKDAIKEATKKEAEVRAAPPAAPPPPSQNAVQLSRAQKRFTPQQQGIASGPRQMQQAADAKTPAFGFHYSIETKGHLIIVPGADGYLSVIANDGTILFSRKQIAAAIRTDIAIPDTVNSVSITFSENPAPVAGRPVLRDGSSGNIEGASALAVEIKVK